MESSLLISTKPSNSLMPRSKLVIKPFNSSASSSTYSSPSASSQSPSDSPNSPQLPNVRKATAETKEKKEKKIPGVRGRKTKILTEEEKEASRQHRRDYTRQHYLEVVKPANTLKTKAYLKDEIERLKEEMRALRAGLLML